jgi:hypothetical protein
LYFAAIALGCPLAGPLPLTAPPTASAMMAMVWGGREVVGASRRERDRDDEEREELIEGVTQSRRRVRREGGGGEGGRECGRGLMVELRVGRWCFGGKRKREEGRTGKKRNDDEVVQVYSTSTTSGREVKGEGRCEGACGRCNRACEGERQTPDFPCRALPNGGKAMNGDDEDSRSTSGGFGFGFRFVVGLGWGWRVAERRERS